jgi:hypothetical protein
VASPSGTASPWSGTRISRVAPVQSKPRELHTVADVIVELALGELPEVDRWLHGLSKLLAGSGSGQDAGRVLPARHEPPARGERVGTPPRPEAYG